MTEDTERWSAPALLRPLWLRRLGVSLVVLAMLWLVGAWLLQPERSVPILLDRVGAALDLDIQATGENAGRLRGTPQLVLRDLVARERGGGRVLLRAERVLVSLPWSTLRSRGADLTLQRVELEAPQLDLTVLLDWLARRPPSGDTRIPVLTDGLRIRDGRLDSDASAGGESGWRIEGMAIDLPSLHPERAVAARLRGRYVDAGTQVPFDLALALTRPADGAGVGIAGRATVQREGWRLPAALVLSGPLRLGNAPDDAVIALVPAHFGASTAYVAGDTRLPFTLGLHGPLRWQDGTLRLAPAGAALRADGMLPSFDAAGRLAVGDRLALDLRGRMPDWPDGWPALPAPIGASDAPLPFALRYDGATNLSDEIALELARDATRFDARFRIDDILAWMNTQEGSPLPPLDARLTTPQLDISGATLEGVEIEVRR